MKKYFLLLALLIILGQAIVHADLFPTMTHSWVLKPTAITTSPVDISTVVTGGAPPGATNISVCYMDIVVTPNNAADVTIADAQGNIFLNSVPIPAPGAGLSPTQGQTYIPMHTTVPEGCKIFWGGMVISADATGATISASGRW